LIFDCVGCGTEPINILHPAQTLFSCQFLLSDQTSTTPQVKLFSYVVVVSIPRQNPQFSLVEGRGNLHVWKELSCVACFCIFLLGHFPALRMWEERCMKSRIESFGYVRKGREREHPDLWLRENF
jgi:hypothetical protein